MNKKFNYKPLIEYTDYAGRKYIKPEKAGDLKKDMELFRKNGQAARKIFTEIVKLQRLWKKRQMDFICRKLAAG